MLLKDQQYLPVSTAPPDDSIWQGINQATFRQNIASLEKSFKTRPGPKEAVPRDGWEKRRAELSSQDYIIPFNTEQQLAEDFAFLVAAEPESKVTSAVCIEEQSEPEGLVVRLAADEPVTTRVRKALKDILGLLVDRAKKRLSLNSQTPDNIHCRVSLTVRPSLKEYREMSARRGCLISSSDSIAIESMRVCIRAVGRGAHRTLQKSAMDILHLSIKH